MPDNPPYWRNFRFSDDTYKCHRHEIFEGRTGNRKKSIEDGLVIFLEPKSHITGKDSIHLNPKKWIWVKKMAVKVWCEHYDKTEDDFRKRYGRLPL